MSEHHMNTGHRDPASSEAERLIEQRLAELRAVALGEQPVSSPTDDVHESGVWGSVTPSADDDPLAAVLTPTTPAPVTPTPVTPQYGEQSPRLSVVPPVIPPDASLAPAEIVPVRQPQYAAETTTPAPTSAPVAQQHVPAAPAAPVAATPAPAAPVVDSTAIARLITSSVGRVEYAVQEDIARLEEMLRTWGAPSEQVMAGMQRVERSLRAELARVLEAIHTVPVNEATVLDRFTHAAEESDIRTGARFDAVRAELEQLTARLDEQSEATTRAAGSAAAIAGSGIGDRVSKSVHDLGEQLIDRLEQVHAMQVAASSSGTERIDDLTELVRATQHALVESVGAVPQQTSLQVDASLTTIGDSIEATLGEMNQTFGETSRRIAREVARGETDARERAEYLTEFVDTAFNALRGDLVTVLGGDLETLEVIADAVARSADTTERVEEFVADTYTRLDQIERQRDERHIEIEASVQDLTVRVSDALDRLNGTGEYVGASPSAIDAALVAAATAEHIAPQIESAVSGTSELRSYLDTRLAEMQDTLLVAQDDVPEELGERITELVDGLAEKVDTATQTMSQSATSSVSGITDAVGGITLAVGSVTDAVASLQERFRTDLGTTAHAQSRHLDRLQTDLVGEIDYNRVKQAQDTELVLDSFGTGFTAMATRMTAIERQLDHVTWQLEQLVTTVAASQTDAAAKPATRTRAASTTAKKSTTSKAKTTKTAAKPAPKRTPKSEG